jgi:hypothetical protein
LRCPAGGNSPARCRRPPFGYAQGKPFFFASLGYAQGKLFGFQSDPNFAGGKISARAAASPARRYFCLRSLRIHGKNRANNICRGELIRPYTAKGIIGDLISCTFPSNKRSWAYPVSSRNQGASGLGKSQAFRAAKRKKMRGIYDDNADTSQSAGGRDAGGRAGDER